MNIDAGIPGLHITALLQPSGVGHCFWIGEVRDDRTNQVVQVRAMLPSSTGGTYPTTIPALRSATMQPGGLGHLADTLRGLVADTAARAA